MKRSFTLTPYQRVAISLDQLLPPGPIPTAADALIELRADGPLWADTAIYFAPLAPGVVASRTPLLFTCTP